MLMGPAVNRFQSHEVQVPGDTLMVHGEQDEVVPLSEAMDWARPRSIPVVVIPAPRISSMASCWCCANWCRRA